MLVRPEAFWEALAPEGLYARCVRTPLLYSFTLLLVPVALLLAVPVALGNLIVYGRPGCILFRQERAGRRGRPFVIYKFRTMRDAGCEGVSDAERVTRWGRWLRNTHLDELPQFLNILCGDMSLIGPRPEMLSIERWAAERLPRFPERLILRPGITGWAQITQGYAADGDEIAYARKLLINQAYREHLSLRTDLSILVRTMVWMLRGKGWQPEAVFERERRDAAHFESEPIQDVA